VDGFFGGIFYWNFCGFLVSFFELSTKKSEVNFKRKSQVNFEEKVK
jgi:hypothetical protein